MIIGVPDEMIESLDRVMKAVFDTNILIDEHQQSGEHTK